MSSCICGNRADTFGGLCNRCAALQTLGLATNASATEIESTYLTLVKVWHPDRFQSDLKLQRAAEEKLKEINAAHDYLNSGPKVETPRPFVREPETGTDREPEEEPEEQFIPADTPGKVPEEVRRLLKRYQNRSDSKMLLKVIVALGAVAVGALLWVSVDFFLSANPKTAGPWEEFKAEVSRDIHANGVRLWTGATGSLPGSKTETAPAPPEVESSLPARVPASGSAPPPVPGARSTSIEVKGAKPYITSGSTPVEVLSILGNPTSSSGEKMFYRGTEIDFRNGRVAGWKIDLKTAPIRVKLWPDSPPVPGLVTFAVGSSKSDVIAVQGTPTLFSDNEFGYGSSLVLFQNDRVVGWKEDPSSVRLRVVAH